MVFVCNVYWVIITRWPLYLQPHIQVRKKKKGRKKRIIPLSGKQKFTLKSLSDFCLCIREQSFSCGLPWLRESERANFSWAFWHHKQGWGSHREEKEYGYYVNNQQPLLQLADSKHSTVGITMEKALNKCFQLDRTISTPQSWPKWPSYLAIQ